MVTENETTTIREGVVANQGTIELDLDRLKGTNVSIDFDTSGNPTVSFPDDLSYPETKNRGQGNPPPILTITTEGELTERRYEFERMGRNLPGNREYIDSLRQRPIGDVDIFESRFSGDRIQAGIIVRSEAEPNKVVIKSLNLDRIRGNVDNVLPSLSFQRNDIKAFTRNKREHEQKLVLAARVIMEMRNAIKSVNPVSDDNEYVTKHSKRLFDRLPNSLFYNRVPDLDHMNSMKTDELDAFSRRYLFPERHTEGSELSTGEKEGIGYTILPSYDYGYGLAYKTEGGKLKASNGRNNSASFYIETDRGDQIDEFDGKIDAAVIPYGPKIQNRRNGISIGKYSTPLLVKDVKGDDPEAFYVVGYSQEVQSLIAHRLRPTQEVVAELGGFVDGWKDVVIAERARVMKELFDKDYEELTDIPEYFEKYDNLTNEQVIIPPISETENGVVTKILGKNSEDIIIQELGMRVISDARDGLIIQPTDPETSVTLVNGKTRTRQELNPTDEIRLYDNDGSIIVIDQGGKKYAIEIETSSKKIPIPDSEFVTWKNVTVLNLDHPESALALAETNDSDEILDMIREIDRSQLFYLPEAVEDNRAYYRLKANRLRNALFLKGDTEKEKIFRISPEIETSGMVLDILVNYFEEESDGIPYPEKEIPSKIALTAIQQDTINTEQAILDAEYQQAKAEYEVHESDYREARDINSGRDRALNVVYHYLQRESDTLYIHRDSENERDIYEVVVCSLLAMTKEERSEFFNQIDSRIKSLNRNERKLISRNLALLDRVIADYNEELGIIDQTKEKLNNFVSSMFSRLRRKKHVVFDETTGNWEISDEMLDRLRSQGLDEEIFIPENDIERISQQDGDE